MKLYKILFDSKNNNYLKCMILLCVFWLVFLPYITQSQPIKPYRRIDTLDFTEIVNETKTEYKNIRKVPEKYDWQAYIALSYYPELKDANIKFVYSKIFTNPLKNIYIPYCLVILIK